MATRSYLTDSEISAAKAKLGREWPKDLRTQFQFRSPTLISKFCEEKLIQRLESCGDWRGCRPILLGSWARHELCPKSDIDLVFIGPESTVLALVENAQKDGLKIRYRMPLDQKDWSKGVEDFDVIALFQARSFFPEDQYEIKKQQDLLWSKGLKYRKDLYRAVRKERKKRAERYDSQANYLEPNLKYGHGGLRDIEQGLILMDICREVFGKDHAAIGERLKSLKGMILFLRQFVHLNGGGETLASSLQKDLADLIGHDHRSIMSDVEFALSEGSFYGDWVSEATGSGANKLNSISKWTPKDADEALASLRKDPSVLRQERLRKSTLTVAKKTGGKIFSKYFNLEMSEDFLNALYRSRLFELFVPEFKNITGLVQHDQYHRYSVDAHLVQTIREVLRTKKSPRRMGRMGSIAKKLTHADWRILLWCALFHDIGKGGKGSHSETGESIAKKRLVALGQSLRETVEISWLVRNHLVLSGAAFRQNPQSPALWAELFSRGIKRDRINRLSVFTAIDIRATNPEAWNEWKDRLLTELCITLHSPTVGQLNKLLEKADKIRPRVKRQLVEQLPPEVVDGVRHQVLLQDLKNIQAVKHNLSPLVVKDSKGGVWVRLHSREDTPGLFLSFTQKIYSCGLNVMAAFVTTLPGYGAYDWFVVRSKRDLRWIRAQLDKAETMDLRQLPAVKFDVMEVISREDKTAIISLRGRDQEGALLHAAKALRSEDLIIHSAKVHTWGKQIDDIFTVAVGPDFEGQMSRLGNRLLPQGKLEL